MARKKTRKKASKKLRKTASKRKVVKKRRTTGRSAKRDVTESPVFLIGVIVALMLVFALTAYVVSVNKPSHQPEESPVDVLVVVNGNSITRQELDFQYDLLPAAYRQQLSKDEVLKQIVNEELVMQEAERLGMSVSPEDVNVRVQQILEDGGLSIADLQKNLDFFNVTMEEFEGLVRRQLLIQSYTDRHIALEDPTDDELQVLYESLKESYTVPEQVSVRHVLVSSQRTDAAEIAKDIYDRARGGEDFCSLVKEFTDDKGSRETCGEYIFPRGFMVPEFEKVSFDSQPGEFSMIQTSFGYHIIEKLKDLPATVKELDEVRDELVSQHQGLQYQQQYSLLLTELQEKADIVYPGEERFEIPVEPAPVDPAEPVAVQDGPVELDEQVEVVEPEEEEPEAPEPEAPEPAEETVSMLDCIAAKSTLYGTSWSTDTQDARDEFKGTGLTYVSCEKKPETCMKAGVQAYPTWVVAGEVYLGRMSVDELALAAEC